MVNYTFHIDSSDRGGKNVEVDVDEDTTFDELYRLVSNALVGHELMHIDLHLVTLEDESLIQGKMNRGAWVRNFQRYRNDELERKKLSPTKDKNVYEWLLDGDVIEYTRTALARGFDGSAYGDGRGLKGGGGRGGGSRKRRKSKKRKARKSRKSRKSKTRRRRR